MAKKSITYASVSHDCYHFQNFVIFSTVANSKTKLPGLAIYRQLKVVEKQKRYFIICSHEINDEVIRYFVSV